MDSKVPVLSNGIWHAYVHWSTLQSLKVTVIVSENSQIVQCVFGGKARKNRDMASSMLMHANVNIFILFFRVLQKQFLVNSQVFVSWATVQSV